MPVPNSCSQILSPTLIIVRVGLGLSHTPTAEEVETLKSPTSTTDLPQHLAFGMAPSPHTSYTRKHGLDGLDDSTTNVGTG
jgi:hypothetical protein